ncbi:MAG: IgGFc-binding protein, partial [Paludibacteraceae bacterium]|nr:IgGFc-binding protein [Paludibacteraceae bacterium]
MKKIVLILFTVVFCVPAFSQIDTEFWFAIPSSTSGHTSGPFSFMIYAESEDATVTIEQPANPSFTPIVVDVPAYQFESVKIANSNGVGGDFWTKEVGAAINTVRNNGFRITSTANIGCYYQAGGNNGEAYTLKGDNGLGTNFLISTQNVKRNGCAESCGKYSEYQPKPYNSVEIVATEDNTEITIIPSVPIYLGEESGEDIIRSRTVKTNTSGETFELIGQEVGALVGQVKYNSNTVRSNRNREPWRQVYNQKSFYSNSPDLAGAGDTKLYYYEFVRVGASNYIYNMYVANYVYRHTWSYTNCSSGILNIRLNKGQTYAIRACGQLGNEHLGGTIIKTNQFRKPFAVNSSDDTVEAGNCNSGYDLIGDQILPVDFAGNDYVVIPTRDQTAFNNYETVTVYATEPDTEIWVTNRSGALVKIATIDPGTGYSFKTSTYSVYGDKRNTPVYVNTSKPTILFQTTGIGAELGGSVLPLLSCSGSTEATYKRIKNSRDGDLTYNLMVRTKFANDFVICDGAVQLTQADFTPIRGTEDWSYIQLSGARATACDPFTIRNTKGPFHIAALDYDGASFTQGFFTDYLPAVEIHLKKNEIL